MKLNHFFMFIHMPLLLSDGDTQIWRRTGEGAGVRAAPRGMFGLT